MTRMLRVAGELGSAGVTALAARLATADCAVERLFLSRCEGIGDEAARALHDTFTFTPHGTFTSR